MYTPMQKLLADLGTCWARNLPAMYEHIVDGLPASPKSDTKTQM